MGATLRIANETGAYTLTDRATFNQHADGSRLIIMFEGDPLLLNTYAAVIDPSGLRAAEAQRLFAWLSDGAGRDVIQRYQLRGVPAFVPWPEGNRREEPDAVPR
jgi:tungstate transport system substrate-binding protein